MQVALFPEGEPGNEANIHAGVGPSFKMGGEEILQSEINLLLHNVFNSLIRQSHDIY